MSRGTVRIALLGDVHANLPALEAVLADARALGAEAVWNVGDHVGYSAFPEEVMERLAAAGAVSIRGNYDEKVLAAPAKAARWRRTKRPEKVLAFLWAHQHLSPASRARLAALPPQRRLEVAGHRVLLCHGSPAAIDDRLTPETPDARLRELAREAAADLVVCGHTHQPFARRVDEVLFVNTGSVGRPEDGDPRASWALLEADGDGLRVRHRRVAYDVDRAAAAIAAHGLPPVFAEMLRRGRSFKVVAAALEDEDR